MISQARFAAIYGGLNTAAQKVYHATPIGEAWSISQIMAEIKRQGQGADHPTTLACLEKLVDVGLAHRPIKGQYIRATVRDRVTKPSTPPPAMPAPSASPAPPPSTLDTMGGLSARASALANELKKLATDIESAALEIEERNAAVAQDLLKVRQLRTLLDSLGTHASTT